MEKILIAIAALWILFELIEHVVFPLVWAFVTRKKRSVCGPTGMLGKVGVVEQWEGAEGRIYVNGELWQAVSDSPLSTGDKALIQDIKGLKVRVEPLKD